MEFHSGFLAGVGPESGTLRVFVFGQRFLDSRSLGSSSLAKSGPDSPIPAFHSPASAKGSCWVCSLGSWSSAKGSWIHSSLFRVFVFGKRWPGQARTVRSRKTFPAGFNPEGLGKGGPDRPGPTQDRTTDTPDRPGQRFVLESIPVFNNHSLRFTP